jgi:putative ABC transport system permease protein
MESLGRTTGSMARVITFGVIGVLVLLVGCSNSISLSLASVIERRREIGIRKAAGAMPGDISLHSLGESVLMSLLALVPAIAAIELLKPAFISLFPFSFILDTGVTDYFLLVFIAVCVGLVNGAYPALLLSRIRPQAVLKVGTTDGVKRGQQLRTILVAVQFCLASMLLVATAALFTQLEVTRRQPLGFTLDNLVSISMSNEQERANGKALLNQLDSIPGVVGATFNLR